jgi:hypothetical protein
MRNGAIVLAVDKELTIVVTSIVLRRQYLLRFVFLQSLLNPLYFVIQDVLSVCLRKQPVVPAGNNIQGFLLGRSITVIVKPLTPAQ